MKVSTSVPLLRLKPSFEVGARDLFLFEEITASSVCRIVTGLRAAQADDSVEKIHLYMCTGGGSVSAGFALYDHIKRSPKPVTIIVSGACMSMGITILQAATHRLATQHCLLMIHPVSTTGGSESVTSTEMKFNAKILARQNKANVKTVCERIGMQPAAYRKLMKPEYYMTPQEAMQIGRHGLIDACIV